MRPGGPGDRRGYDVASLCIDTVYEPCNAHQCRDAMPCTPSHALCYDIARRVESICEGLCELTDHAQRFTFYDVLNPSQHGEEVWQSRAWCQMP